MRVERVRGGRRPLEQQRALAEVVDAAAPGTRTAYQAMRIGARAEVAHVGVQRLAAGDAQDDRAQHQEAVPPVVRRRSARRRAGSPPAGSPGGARSRAARRRRSRRTRHSVTGPKTAPMPPVPRFCTANSASRMTQVIGTTNGREGGGRDLEALDRRQHRDRRRDHAVAVEQRRAEQPEHDQQHPAAVDVGPGRARQLHGRRSTPSRASAAAPCARPAPSAPARRPRRRCRRA